MSEPTLLIDRPEACTAYSNGALVAIRRATLGREQLRDAIRAIDAAHARHPSGLVLLSAYRLSPAFPIQVDFERSVGDYAAALRALDRVFVANAVLVEFGGVRAAALRTVARAVWTLARPRASMAFFDRLSDAAEWIVPHGRAVGALAQAGEYVRLYRMASDALAEHDAAHELRRRS